MKSEHCELVKSVYLVQSVSIFHEVNHSVFAFSSFARQSGIHFTLTSKTEFSWESAGAG